MDKKTIFLELPSEMVDKIDQQNVLGDRSTFISDLLNKQLDTGISNMDVSTELTSHMQKPAESFSPPGEIKLLNNKGAPIGNFNINTLEGFESLAEKICELSDDPVVRMKARRWR